MPYTETIKFYQFVEEYKKSDVYEIYEMHKELANFESVAQVESISKTDTLRVFRPHEDYYGGHPDVEVEGTLDEILQQQSPCGHTYADCDVYTIMQKHDDDDGEYIRVYLECC